MSLDSLDASGRKPSLAPASAQRGTHQLSAHVNTPRGGQALLKPDMLQTSWSFLLSDLLSHKCEIIAASSKLTF